MWHAHPARDFTGETPVPISKLGTTHFPLELYESPAFDYTVRCQSIADGAVPNGTFFRLTSLTSDKTSRGFISIRSARIWFQSIPTPFAPSGERSMRSPGEGDKITS